MIGMIRSLAIVAFCCVIAFTVSSAWADEPIDYQRELPFGPMPFWDCTQFDGLNFWIWGEGREMDVGKIFLEKDGWFKQSVGKIYTDEGVLWAPADPGCNDPPFMACTDPWTPMPGTRVFSLDDSKGTSEHRTVIYRDWIFVDPPGFWWPTWGQEMGLYFRIVIPGYGTIFNMAGLIEIQLNFTTGNWDVLHVTPNWNEFDPDDVRALCEFMGS